MIEGFTLYLSRNPRCVGIVRSILSDLAARNGFSRQAVEDMGLAVSEACTNALQHGYSNDELPLTVDFKMPEGRMVIEVKDHGRGLTAERRPLDEKGRPIENGLHLGQLLMRQLMDEVSYPTNGNRGTTVRLVKYRR